MILYKQRIWILCNCNYISRQKKMIIAVPRISEIMRVQIFLLTITFCQTSFGFIFSKYAQVIYYFYEKPCYNTLLLSFL